MYNLIITVETREEAEDIEYVLGEAQDEGKLDFPINTELEYIREAQ